MTTKKEDKVAAEEQAQLSAAFQEFIAHRSAARDLGAEMTGEINKVIHGYSYEAFKRTRRASMKSCRNEPSKGSSRRP